MTELLALLEQELGTPVDPDLPLLSSGLIDSLRFAQVLTVLQERYGLAIDCRDVGVDNFDTPEQMLAFINSRR